MYLYLVRGELKTTETHPIPTAAQGLVFDAKDVKRKAEHLSLLKEPPPGYLEHEAKELAEEAQNLGSRAQRESKLAKAEKLAKAAEKLAKAAEKLAEAAQELAEAAQELAKAAEKLAKAAEKLPQQVEITVTHKVYVGQTTTPLRVMDQVYDKFLKAEEFADKWPDAWILEVGDLSDLSVGEGAYIELLREWFGEDPGAVLTINDRNERTPLRRAKMRSAHRISLQWAWQSDGTLAPCSWDSDDREGWASAPLSDPYTLQQGAKELIAITRTCYSAGPNGTTNGGRPALDVKAWEPALSGLLGDAPECTVIDLEGLAQKLRATALIFSNLANADFGERSVSAGTAEQEQSLKDRAQRWATLSSAQLSAFEQAFKEDSQNVWLVGLIRNEIIVGCWPVCAGPAKWETIRLLDKAHRMHVKYSASLRDYQEFERWAVASVKGRKINLDEVPKSSKAKGTLAWLWPPVRRETVAKFRRTSPMVRRRRAPRSAGK